MALSKENIQKNYEKHLKIVETYITERKDKVLSMIDSYQEDYALAPASGKSWYHNAFQGGYVDHVNRVVEYAVKQSRLYKEMGGTVDYTEEELVFAALFHDLGKLGDGEKVNYLPQTDKWRQDKLSEMYTNNSDLDFMLIPDRSLFVLQKFGIPVSQKEFLAIRLHDGVFDEANKAYFFSYKKVLVKKHRLYQFYTVQIFLLPRWNTICGRETVVPPSLQYKKHSQQQVKE